MVTKWLLQSLAWTAAFAVLLFVPAGRLDWPAAWVFVGVMLLIGLGCGSWLAKNNPELLAERMRSPIQRDQPAADKKIVAALGLTFLIWFIVIGLDERFHPSRMPVALQAIGLAFLIISTALIMRVFRENSFAAAVVKVQSERGHRVISTGPYALVRHPMYTVYERARLLRRERVVIGIVVGSGNVPDFRDSLWHPYPDRGKYLDSRTARLC
jgi:hypothetical protein